MRAKIATVLYWVAMAWFVGMYLLLAGPTLYWFRADNEWACLLISAPVLNVAQWPGAVLALVSLILDFRTHRLVTVLVLVAVGVAGWGACEAVRGQLHSA